MQDLLLSIFVIALIAGCNTSRRASRRTKKSTVNKRTPTATTTIIITPHKQSNPTSPDPIDMAYEYDNAAQAYYRLACSYIDKAKSERDPVKSNALRCKAAEAILKADKYAQKAQQ